MPLHKHTLFDRHQLADLRLVSERFSEFASPRFLQRINITRNLNSNLFSQEKDFTIIMSLSESDNAHDVRELVVGVRSDDRDLMSSYHRGLKEIMPDLLQAFTGLRVLTIVSSELTSSLTIPSPLSRGQAILLTNTVYWAFKEDIPLPTIDNPFWSMPQCQPAIAQAPILLESSIMDRWKPTDFPLTYSSATIRSGSQRLFDEEFYEDWFFPFLEEASNLRHLCLRHSYRRPLELDLLNVSHFARLEIVQLIGIEVSYQHLVTLFSRNEGTLRAVELQLVQLITGDWERIFRILGGFEALEDLLVVHCSYV